MKNDVTATSGGPPPQDLTPAEGLAMSGNWDWPVIEGIEGRPPQTLFPKVLGNNMYEAFNKYESLSGND